MNTLRTTPKRAHPRVRAPERPGGFMKPLPLRREHRHGVSLETAGEWDTWWGREAHPDIPGPRRHFAVLVLWLLVVIGMILLLAEMAH